MKYSFENKNPLWYVTEGRTLKTNQIIVDDEVVQAYPDNDGACGTTIKRGRWCGLNETDSVLTDTHRNTRTNHI